MNDPAIKAVTLDGKYVGYTSETEFLVQVGKGKGSYKTRYSFIGRLELALFYYRSINIGNGYKKRLLMPACSKKPVLARQISEYQIKVSTDKGKTWQKVKEVIVKVPVKANELYFCFEGDRLVTHAVTPDSSQGTDIQLYEELGDNLVDV